MRQTRFDTDPRDPPIVQAASLTIGVLKAARACSVAELGGTIPATIALDDDQLALMNSHLHVIGHLRCTGHAPDGSKIPTVTLAACPACGRWQLVEGAAPSRCQMTFGCGGAPTKASAAPRRTDNPPPPTERPA